MAPLCGGSLARGVGLRDAGQLADDQLQDLDQQGDAGPALRVWKEEEAPRPTVPGPLPREAVRHTSPGSPLPSPHPALRHDGKLNSFVLCHATGV